MSEKCFTRNPLVRDGTNQGQRILQTLLPAYVAVDERSMKDLAEFAYKFSAEVQYYNHNNTADSTWEPFFDLNSDWSTFSLDEFLAALKIDQEAKPHLALFFGFLYMFKVAQDDMNTITQRHLDFYYREVLQLKQNPAVPDQVAVIFKLAKHVDAYQVKAGTKLKAGKDDTGVELIYEVEKDVAVNIATIDELKAVYTDKPTTDLPSRDHRIYASTQANSSDGKGGDIENDELSWETFGKDNPLDNRDFGDIGFAIASPLLNLAEGDRIVQFIFDLKSVSSDVAFASDDIKVWFSGEKEWILSEAVEVEFSPGKNVETELIKSAKQLIINRKLTAAQDPVLAYDAETLSDPFSAKWPVAKIVLNQAGSKPDIYNLLKSLEPDKVTVKVNVTGVRNLILQNDQAVLDASKPFQPFGNRPHIGSNFYIGSWEVFQKELTNLDISIKWKDLPAEPVTSTGFQGYYFNYLDYTASERANDKFEIAVKVIEDKIWENVDTSKKLFTDATGTPLGATDDLPGPDDANSKILVSEINGKVKTDEGLDPFEAYSTDTVKGFLRLILKNRDFGHKSYPNSYAKQAIDLAKWNEPVAELAVEKSSLEAFEALEMDPNALDWYVIGEPQLPNEPYTPTIEELLLNYSAEAEINLQNESSTSFTEGVDQFYYLHPFGVNRLDSTGIHKDFTESSEESKPKNYLLPQYDNEGNLYIGIKDLKPPQTLSVLFQCAEGSANPEANQQPVTWSYLKNNYWIKLDPDKQILADGTDGLLNSGIIRFDLPKEMSSTNSLLPSGKYWLRASVTEQADAVCDLIDVKAQAVLALFEDNGNDPDHLRTPLEAGTIAKLKTSDSSIDKVEQPYASFGGQISEQSPEFYTRVSERLRHKHRAITIWDYEHLILQKFPDVYKVKCINHTFYDGDLTTYSEMSPGNVTLIIISNVFNKNAVDPLRPKTSLSNLSAIDSYIKTINPPCANIYVKNPVYEEIKVEFDVKFRQGIDTGIHTLKLEQEIKDFLAPWASDCPTDIRFGGKIHKSMILNFVEERSYVDFVTCFKMYHIAPDDPDNNPNADVDEVVASRAITILGSADSHTVNPIPSTEEGCTCDDNEVITAEKMASIDDCSLAGSVDNPAEEEPIEI